MLHVYAVEPACLGEWQNFRYVIEGFGVSHGRLISQFPKDWPKRVFDACASFTFRQRQQLQIELERIKKHALIRSSRAYDGALSWPANAVNQHQNGKPFHAVIVKEAAGQPDYVLGVDDLSVSNPLWRPKKEDKIPRTPTDLGNAVRHLLCMSDRILFVDKMYHPAKQRWQDTLIHFITLASAGRTPPSFEYHSEIDNDALGKPESQRIQEYQNACNLYLKHLLPTGSQIRMHRWTKWNDKSDFFHARYILTEKGGVRVDWGLDADKPGQKTDVSLLEEDMWKQTWDLFQVDATGKQLSTQYQWIDSVVV
jgi:hypothetical protein